MLEEQLNTVLTQLRDYEGGFQCVSFQISEGDSTKKRKRFSVYYNAETHYFYTIEEMQAWADKITRRDKKYEILFRKFK